MSLCYAPTRPSFSFFFFFNDTAPTEISPLPLHDALPISTRRCQPRSGSPVRRWSTHAPCSCASTRTWGRRRFRLDRKSTRLNSSHDQISYAVFCLKKKKHNIDERSSTVSE